MTGFTTGMKTSLTDQWATPRYVFDALDKEFGFTLDVCADETNHKCARYFDKETDGLRQPWTGVCWMNPPYGRTIGDWVKKAYEESRGGGSRSIPHSGKDGYKMVERIRYACF
jgi:phage N-6-adenine-methyltransferase